jgi:4-hydroxythreonine-4-phosphate dehydrogenase
MNATEKPQAEGQKVKVGITHGDLNGISYEVIMKTFLDQRIMEDITPIVYGCSKVASYHRKTLNINDFNFNPIKNASLAVPRRANIVNLTQEEVKIDLGKSTPIAGELAYQALEAAVNDLMSNHIDAVVTAPINKKNIQSAHFNFPGHTEYFATRFGQSDYLMLMVLDNFRVGVITGHMPLHDVPAALSEELILKKIGIMHNSLVKDFAIRKPKIALLGLNPHSGDDGLLGNEEKDIIIPAIEKAKEQNFLVFGPYPADGFFGSESYLKFDGILAMYHDQGMIPFKVLSFDRGVNFTAGLPYVRTSPAHGTAYDIAGKNEASPDSFREAVYLAVDILRNRREFEELQSNPLQNYLKEIETSSDAVIEKEIPGTHDEDPDNLMVDPATSI